MALEKPGKLREFFSPTLWPLCTLGMLLLLLLVTWHSVE